MMDRLVRSMGGRYLHVLQPNQWYGGREFSAEEKAVAFTTQEPYVRFPTEIVGPVYDLMRAAAPALRKGGVQFLDGTVFFDDVRGPVYSDVCCHILKRGNAIMLQEIMSALQRRNDPTSPTPK